MIEVKSWYSLFLAGACLIGTFADSPLGYAASPKARSSKKSVVVVDSWDREKVVQFTQVLCSEKSYFRHCFEATEQECERKFDVVILTCKRNLQNNRTKLTALSMGFCVGTAVEKEWSEKKSTKSECSDREKWM